MIRVLATVDVIYWQYFPPRCGKEAVADIPFGVLDRILYTGVCTAGGPGRAVPHTPSDTGVDASGIQDKHFMVPMTCIWRYIEASYTPLCLDCRSHTLTKGKRIPEGHTHLFVAG